MVCCDSCCKKSKVVGCVKQLDFAKKNLLAHAKFNATLTPHHHLHLHHHHQPQPHNLALM
jgi:hypothetical protein